MLVDVSNNASCLIGICYSGSAVPFYKASELFCKHFVLFEN